MTVAGPDLVSNGGWESEIAAFEARDARRKPAPGGVLFVGSSTIAKWRSLERDFPGVPTIRRGFGGSEVRDSTFYAPRIVWPYEPRLIVLYAGDNDLASGRPARQVLEDWAAFVARVRERLPETTIAWISIKPSPSRVALMDTAREANALVRAWVEERAGQRLRCIDVWGRCWTIMGSREASCSGATGCT
jgi:hypothetical protein